MANINPIEPVLPIIPPRYTYAIKPVSPVSHIFVAGEYEKGTRFDAHA